MLYQDDLAKIREMIADGISNQKSEQKANQSTSLQQEILFKKYKEEISSEVEAMIDAKISSLSIEKEEVIEVKAAKKTNSK